MLPTIELKRKWWVAMSLAAAHSGNPLYPLARTGPVVPAHPGDDREQGEVERELRQTHSAPRCALLRVRRFLS